MNKYTGRYAQNKRTNERHFIAGFITGVIGIIISFIIILSLESKPLTYSTPQEKQELVYAEITAYTASEDETDDRPWEMANGEEVFVGAIACPNKYDFGQRLLIKNRVYVCADRMNARYRDGNYFDIYFPSKEKGLAFGRQNLTVEILQ